MKKILFASTALALSAGVAAADVSFSGNARFGLMYNSDPLIGDANWANTGNTSKTRLEKRFQLDIDARTTADNGVTFGARVRARSEERSHASGGQLTFSGARVYAQAGGFTVAAGNILGAIEVMPGIYAPSVGLTGLSWGGLVTNTVAKGYFNWDAFSNAGAGAEGIEVIYNVGDFTVHASYTSDDLNGGFGVENISVYGAYNWSGWTFALGFVESDNATRDKIVGTVGGRIGDFGVGFAVADNDGTMKYAINGSYNFGATTVSAYVAKEENVDTNYGIGASYNLGGGARLVGGIERTQWDSTRADLGVTFNF